MVACIIPFKRDASKLVPGHVKLDAVEFLEEVKERVEVFNARIFKAKVIYNGAELQGTPFVVPETWGGSSFMETLGHKTGAKKRSLARMPAWGRP